MDLTLFSTVILGVSNVIGHVLPWAPRLYSLRIVVSLQYHSRVLRYSLRRVHGLALNLRSCSKVQGKQCFAGGRAPDPKTEQRVYDTRHPCVPTQRAVLPSPVNIPAPFLC